MIKVKISKRRVLELDGEFGFPKVGQPDGAEQPGGRYAYAGMEETTDVQELAEYDAHLDDGTPVCEACLHELIEENKELLEEAKYKGRKVKLNKPMRGDVKKFKVFVKDPKTGNVKKVNFGDKNMRIKKNNPKRRKSFRARHNCDNPGPKTKARYWSCKKW